MGRSSPSQLKGPPFVLCGQLLNPAAGAGQLTLVGAKLGLQVGGIGGAFRRVEPLPNLVVRPAPDEPSDNYADAERKEKEWNKLRNEIDQCDS